MDKRALITGISGQDGAYLSRLLLEKGYAVTGLVRRSSMGETYPRIAEIQDKITLLPGDMSDEVSLRNAVEKVEPHEVYNLAANSLVSVSWGQPQYVSDVNALGVLRLLEAIRHFCPKARFYQASTSEMFGMVRESPQRETTPFYPRSPYGIAKVYAHQMTTCYRESYGLFACSGILFNHECVTDETPIIIRQNGVIDIVPIGEVVPHRTDPHGGTCYTTKAKGLEVWDKDKFSNVTCMTATWNKAGTASDKRVMAVNARGGYYEATADHVSIIKGGGEKKTADLKSGDNLELGIFPWAAVPIVTSVSTDEAEFFGMMVADGYVQEDGTHARFTKTDDTLRERAGDLWTRLTGGITKMSSTPSGFDDTPDTPVVDLSGCPPYARWLREQIYCKNGKKRIPKRVLNADCEAATAFLRGYNKCDGLKNGHGTSEFRSFTTNSSVLACGLWYLVSRWLNLRMTSHPERREDSVYHHLNVNSPNGGGKGKHLQRPLDEVKSVTPIVYTGWVFDLETDSGTFSAGVGMSWIHNSPMRGPEFVTRKITQAVAAIKHGTQHNLNLGNLGPRRDWGYAGDYVRAMWLMLQQDVPTDYVVGTGENHSVQEFVQTAFAHAGMDWRDYVDIDPLLCRPAEVDSLLADASKARKELGWEPTVSFQQLVRMMVDADLERTDKGIA